MSKSKFRFRIGRQLGAGIGTVFFLVLLIATFSTLSVPGYGAKVMTLFMIALWATMLFCAGAYFLRSFMVLELNQDGFELHSLGKVNRFSWKTVNEVTRQGGGTNLSILVRDENQKVEIPVSELQNSSEIMSLIEPHLKEPMLPEIHTWRVSQSTIYKMAIGFFLAVMALPILLLLDPLAKDMIWVCLMLIAILAFCVLLFSYFGAEQRILTQHSICLRSFFGKTTKLDFVEISESQLMQEPNSKSEILVLAGGSKTIRISEYFTPSYPQVRDFILSQINCPTKQ